MPRKKATSALPEGVLAQTSCTVVDDPRTTREVLTFVVEVIVHNACANNQSAVATFNDALGDFVSSSDLDEFSAENTFVESYTVKLTDRK